MTDTLAPERSSLYGGCTDRAILDTEGEIKWLEDPAAYPYLRERVVDAPTRGGSLAQRGLFYRVVGYAKLRRDTLGRTFRRRIWYLKPNCDPYADHGHRGWPIEAVWPASVAAGQMSKGPTDAEHRAALVASGEYSS